MRSPAVVVGAFARIEPSLRAACRAALEVLPGVTTFDLVDPDKLGLVLEAEGIDAAHARLAQDVLRTDGVLGVWPVSIESDDDFGLRPDDFGLRPDDFGLRPDDFGLRPDDGGLDPACVPGGDARVHRADAHC